MIFISLLKKRIQSKELSRLYAQPEEINVLRFFKIMEMGTAPDLNLLKKKASKKVSKRLLEKTWNDLREFYFSSINKQSFDKFKRDFSRTIDLKNEITILSAAKLLHSYGDEEGESTLKEYGINTKDEKTITSGINRKETKLRLIYNRIGSKGEAEALNFWEILADVDSKLPHPLDVEKINLARWVEIVNGIRKRELSKRDSAQKGKPKKK